MRKKRLHTIIEVTCSSLILVLAGCGSATVQYSDDEMKQIAEYVAYSYLKEQTAENSRLVDDAAIEEYDKNQAAWEEARKAGEEQKKLEEKKGNEGMRPTEDTPTENKNKKSDGSNLLDSFEEIVPYYHLPENVTISYKNYSLLKSYMDASDQAIAMEASAGKQLLIMNFEISNSGESAVVTDLFSKTNAMSVSVNGNRYGVQKTILPNDMTTFCEELQPGETRQLIYLIEVDQSVTESNEMIFRLKNSETDVSFILK